jgi:hypothetical protein
MRYKVVEGSQSYHCCFEYTVVDTSNITILDKDGSPVCETFELWQAEMIADALNISEEVGETI